jgi:hypothetical protein
MRSARSCAGPTGQPARYDDGRSAAVTVDTEPENAGATAAPCSRERGVVSIGFDANVVVVVGAATVVVVGDVAVVDVVVEDVVVVAGACVEPDDPHAAPAIKAAAKDARSATHRTGPRRTAS